MPNLNYKQDFLAFEKSKDLVYLDSAATTLRPEVVGDAVANYAKNYHANIHRGAYKLSYEATAKYDEVRQKVAKMIHAAHVETIVFTYGATDGLNLLMRCFLDDHLLKAGDNMVISIFEHHSNIVPWQQLCQRSEAELRYLYDFSNESLEKINENTKLVSVSLMSNAIGLKLPVESIIKRAHEVGALVILDGAQYIGHEEVNVEELDVDFLVFSGHKMFGPTGVGVLYGKKELLKTMGNYRFGGDMIEYVTEQTATFASLPNRYEAGTPNIEGVIGLGAAIDYIQGIGLNKISTYLNDLRLYAIASLKELPFIDIIEVDKEHSGPVISFNVADVHPHDVSSILDTYGIAIRAGHHCAQPLMKYLNCLATCRLSLQIYNTKEDIDFLTLKLKEVRRWLGYES